MWTQTYSTGSRRLSYFQCADTDLLSWIGQIELFSVWTQTYSAGSCRPSYFQCADTDLLSWIGQIELFSVWTDLLSCIRQTELVQCVDTDLLSWILQNELYSKFGHRPTQRYPADRATFSVWTQTYSAGSCRPSYFQCVDTDLLSWILQTELFSVCGHRPTQLDPADRAILGLGSHIENSLVYRMQVSRCLPFIPEDKGRSTIINTVFLMELEFQHMMDEVQNNRINNK
jgi:succinate dehydrogenase flavin-adding protein (antitoxin of CptAB toxin-antitoxin module)